MWVPVCLWAAEALSVGVVDNHAEKNCLRLTMEESLASSSFSDETSSKKAAHANMVVRLFIHHPAVLVNTGKAAKQRKASGHVFQRQEENRYQIQGLIFDNFDSSAQRVRSSQTQR